MNIKKIVVLKEDKLLLLSDEKPPIIVAPWDEPTKELYEMAVADMSIPRQSIDDYRKEIGATEDHTEEIMQLQARLDQLSQDIVQESAGLEVSESVKAEFREKYARICELKGKTPKPVKG